MKEKIKCLTGNKLKLIAIISMLIDHIFKIIVPLAMNKYIYPKVELGIISIDTYNNILQNISTYILPFGRLAFPIFCFLIVEGFIHTKNIKKYMLTLLTFALISEIPFDIFIFHDTMIKNATFPIYLEFQNVMFTLLLGVVALILIKKIEEIFGNEDKENKRKSKGKIEGKINIINKNNIAITVDKIIKIMLDILVIIIIGGISIILKLDYSITGIRIYSINVYI